MKARLGLSDVAERLGSVVSDVWKIPYSAARLQQQGFDVIRLCVGDPDFDTPHAVHSAVTESLRQGRTHYSSAQGEPELRKAIAESEFMTSGQPCDPDNIVVFPGGTNALYGVLNCLLNAGDELIVPDPMYIGYCGIFASVGCRVTRVPLKVSDNFSIDIDDIEAAISDKTRAVLVNTPGNPAGNMVTSAQLARLAEFCLERGIWLISDEVYSMITFEKQHISLHAAAKAPDNVIIVNSMSKSHAMSGWRMGWAVAPPGLVPSLVSFSDSTLFGCAPFVQDAAAFALRNNKDNVADMQEEYRRRRDYVVSRVSVTDNIRCYPPAAGMFVMVDVSATGLDGNQFGQALLEEQKISIVPGGGFGASTSDFVRVTLAQPIEVLSEAFDRIETFIDRRCKNAT